VADRLDLSELFNCLSEVMEADISLELTQKVCDEFDKDDTDTIDIAEFSMMVVRTNECYQHI
jgi:Ca2+-binding EF-hand superfamily protein